MYFLCYTEASDDIMEFKGNAQFIFLCNPQKSSVNVCLTNLIKKHCHKKVSVCFNNLGAKNFKK